MAFPLYLREKIKIPAALIAGIVCILFAKSGFLMFFFLVPLGFVCFRYNGETSWAAFAFASGLNLILSLLSMAALEIPAGPAVSNLVFFISITAIFTWINAPKLLTMPGAWRLTVGSVLMTLIFLLIFYQRLENELVYEALRVQMGELNTLYKSASSDTVQKALLDSLTPEVLIETIKALMFRGGALVSAVFMFWMSRQAGITLTRFSLGFASRPQANQPGNTTLYRPRFLKNFYADSRLIWVFSVSLATILLLRFFNAGGIGSFSPPLEILLWNILVLCAILYFAQGLGVLQYFVTRPSVPAFVRLLLPVLFVILLFSPGINTVLLGLVILLGITENWAAFRQPKPWAGGRNRPPSTPEAGGG